MSRFLIDNYGYNPGAYQNYSVKTPGYKLMARVDWNINRNHALNVRFSRTQNKYSSAPSSSISPLNAGKVYDKDVYGRTSVYAMYFGNSRYYQEQNFTSVAAELNSRFMDSRLTNTLRYTYSHQYEPRSYDGGIFPTVDILEPAENGASALYASFGLDPFTEGNLREVSTHILTDEIGYTLGKHRLVAGLQFEHNLTTNGYLQGGAGYYVYESWDDFKNDKAPLAFRIAHGNNDALSRRSPSSPTCSTRSTCGRDQRKRSFQGDGSECVSRFRSIRRSRATKIRTLRRSSPTTAATRPRICPRRVCRWPPAWASTGT